MRESDLFATLAKISLSVGADGFVTLTETNLLDTMLYFFPRVFFSISLHFHHYCFLNSSRYFGSPGRQ